MAQNHLKLEDKTIFCPVYQEDILERTNMQETVLSDQKPDIWHLTFDT